MKFADYNDRDRVLGLRKAVTQVTGEIINIGRALGISGKRIDEIKRIHKSGDRRAIAIIDTWLRSEDVKATPVLGVSEKTTPQPSWWNLVWAVAHNVGGNNPAQAQIIAKDYKGMHCRILTWLRASFSN